MATKSKWKRKKLTTALIPQGREVSSVDMSVGLNVNAEVMPYVASLSREYRSVKAGLLFFAAASEKPPAVSLFSRENLLSLIGAVLVGCWDDNCWSFFDVVEIEVMMCKISWRESI